jgi:superfamily II DNA or RNA helicase
MEYLKEYQVNHVKNLIFALRYNNAAVDLSDTGTGKTWTALIVCKEMGTQPIIVCPKSVIPTWYEVCSAIGIEPLCVVNYESAKNGKYYPDLQSFYDNVREPNPYIDIIRTREVGTNRNIISGFEWKLPNNCLVIFDEAHRGKNGIGSTNRTITSRFMASAKPFLDKDNRKQAVFLSATVTDKIECMDVVTYHLGMYSIYDTKFYLNFTFQLGDNPMQRLHKILMPRYGSRMSKESADFTHSEISAVMVDINPRNAQEIEAAHQEMAGALDDLENKTINAACYLVILLRARQRIELLKTPAYAIKIMGHLAQNRHVVMFLNFKESKDRLTNLLIQEGVNLQDMDYIDGSNTAESRETINKKFLNDEIKVLICNIASGGVGLSLHDIHGNHQRASILSPSWSAILVLQALGRIDRQGARSDTIQEIVYVRSATAAAPPIAVVAENPENPENPEVPAIPIEQVARNARTYKQFTVEELICNNLKDKLKNISNINDGNLFGYEVL